MAFRSLSIIRLINKLHIDISVPTDAFIAVINTRLSLLLSSCKILRHIRLSAEEMLEISVSSRMSTKSNYVSSAEHPLKFATSAVIAIVGVLFHYHLT
jgi:hypothetical protein